MPVASQFEPALESGGAQFERPQVVIAECDGQLSGVLKFDPPPAAAHRTGVIQVSFPVVVDPGRLDPAAGGYPERISGDPPGCQRIVDLEHQIPMHLATAAVLV